MSTLEYSVAYDTKAACQALFKLYIKYQKLCRYWTGDLAGICYSCARVAGDLTYYKGIDGGETGATWSGEPITRVEKVRVQTKFNRRGASGESRARLQIRDQQFCDSFLHVFNQYVASISVIVTNFNNRPFVRSVHETVH